MVVPDITAAALAKRGFDVPTLSTYLATGMAPQGTSFDSMYTVTLFDQCDGTGGRARRSPSICSPARTASWRCRRVSRTVAASRRS